MCALLRRRSAEQAVSPSSHLDGSSKLALKYPALWEFLTMTAWEVGVPRQTGSVTLFLDEGRLKACLSDKDAALVAFVSADSLEALLLALEAGLAADKLDWRKAREQGGGRVRRPS